MRKRPAPGSPVQSLTRNAPQSDRLLANALRNAISDTDGRLHELFVERLPRSLPVSRVKQVFAGKKVRGKEEGYRRSFVRSDYLPPDCIEVYWGFRGPGRITDLEVIRELARRIRKSLGIPTEPATPEGEGSPAKPTPPPDRTPTPSSLPRSTARSDATTPDFPELEARKDLIADALAAGKTGEEIYFLLKSNHVVTTIARVERFCQALAPEPPCAKAAKAEPKPPAEPAPSSPAEPFKLSKWLAEEFGQALKGLREQATANPPVEKQPPYKPPRDQEASPKIDATEEEVATPEPPLPPIDPRLFEIHNPNRLEWLDSGGLINFSGDDSEADLWRIRDASEGLLIFGAVGSGKTSGSGAAFARAFLQAGFGGLVLTAKPDEARRWLRMCQETSRSQDCVHVTPGSGHKLNFLQYEIQRPGERIAVTDDLIPLFRRLIGVTSRSKRSETGDDFGSNTTNQLIRKLIDLFLLAGEPLTLDRMVHFINLAPRDEAKDWRGIKKFASVITRAEKAALQGTDEDKRIYREAFEYWTQTFPRITRRHTAASSPPSRPWPIP